ncbi:hypothetical protein ACIPWI_27555 [Streptomyces sp. NPDC090046]|uniref:hypothetical protein n=1 Tax=Streptomyces sp. NPDC090046 TaxID=3365928 RepID=UPI00380F03FD
MTGSPLSPSFKDTAPGGGGRPHTPWTHADLAELGRSGYSSLRTVCDLLDVLCRAPEVPVSTTRLLPELGVTRNELGGRLSYLSRWTFEERGRGNWPLMWAEFPSEDPQFVDECSYVVTQATAEAWAGTPRA